MSIQPGRAVTGEEKAAAQEHLNRARAAMRSVDGYDQATVDRLCRAVAWATANEQTFGRLTRMSVNESGMGSAEGVPARRWKILGILRDALRAKSVGIIEDLPEKGIVKYAKPAGVIAGVLPVTNPLVTARARPTPPSSGRSWPTAEPRTSNSSSSSRRSMPCTWRRSTRQVSGPSSSDGSKIWCNASRRRAFRSRRSSWRSAI